MKRLVLAAIAAAFALPAFAADLKTAVPVKAPPAPVVVYDPYTGFYLGAEAGYGFNLGNIGTSQFVDLGTLSAAPQGFAGGFFGGLGTRVPGLFSSLGLDGYIGAEGNWDFANLNGSAAAPGLLIAPSGAPAGTVASVKDNWLASIRARFGLIYQNVMFYGTAGYGWGGAALTGSVVDPVTGQVGASASSSGTVSGFTWGGGVEFPWFFGNGWKARFQYLQYDFGSQNTLVSNPAVGITPFMVSAKDRVDEVMAGLSYKF